MPELPEVETIRLQLSQFILGQTVKEIKIYKSKSFVGNEKLLFGAKIINLQRFAKLLAFEFSNSYSLVIHLKLTGQLIYRGLRQPAKMRITDPLLATLPNKYTRVVITFTNNDHLFFNDLRIFGWMKVVKSDEVESLVENLGPDPLRDLTFEKFQKILTSKKPIKLILMDQEKISGVGNIYANEALFLAGINPETRACHTSQTKRKLLFDMLLKVLRDSIKWGGASEDNYRDALGQMGETHKHFFVYGRKGERCIRCQAIIKRISLGGRGTYFCPKCQRMNS